MCKFAAEKLKQIFFFIFDIFYLPHSKDGYKFKFNNIDNCGGKNQIVTVDSNFTSSLNKKCEVTTVGCVSSKGFKEATVIFDLIFVSVFFVKCLRQNKFSFR